MLATAFAHQLWQQQQVDCACYADLRGKPMCLLDKLQNQFEERMDLILAFDALST